MAHLWGSNTATKYWYMTRGFFLFDTSALPEGLTIISAVLYLYGYSKASALGETSIEIAASNPASNIVLAATDYANISRTSFASIAYGSFALLGYNTFTLNQDGINNISSVGISKFSAQLGWDLTNDTTGLVWALGKATYFGTRWAENTGTTQDPKLVVTYNPRIGSSAFGSHNAMIY